MTPLLWGLLAVSGLIVGRYAIDFVRPYRTVDPKDTGILEHANSQTIDDVRVTASALGPRESAQVFGAPVALDGIQPVWLEVENRSAEPLFFLRAGTDPEWFSPYEAFWLNRFKVPRAANRRMEDRFYSLAFRNPIPPGATTTGFVLTRLDEGLKGLDMDLVALGRRTYSFSLLLPVPGFEGDFRARLARREYAESELVHLETEDELRAELAGLPTHTANRAGDRTGDPLNLVMVGDRRLVFSSFVRRGWHPTERTYAAAVWKTIRSAVLRSRYRYSPVSDLYVFGRPQDVAAQKARGTINLRNHARFWATHLRYRGQEVFLGQISRDIGVRVIADIPPTTHKIDPDVDEARDGLLQDLAYSQSLASFGYVPGAPRTPRDAPGHNLTGDPFFTDGLRVVLFFDERPFTLAEVQAHDWERTEPMRQAAVLDASVAE